MPEFDYSLVTAGFRLVVSASLPFIVAALIGGVVAGVIRASTQIDDTIISLSGKLFAVVLVGYLLLSSSSSSVVSFARNIWDSSQFYY